MKGEVAMIDIDSEEREVERLARIAVEEFWCGHPGATHKGFNDGGAVYDSYNEDGRKAWRRAVRAVLKNIKKPG